MFQAGIPGGPELLIIGFVLAIFAVMFVIPGYLIARDAKKRGSDHRIAWGLMTVLTTVVGALIGGIFFVIFYLIVRDDIGPSDLERSNDED